MTITELIADLGQALVDNGEDLELHGYLAVTGYTGPRLVDLPVQHGNVPLTDGLAAALAQAHIRRSPSE